MAEVTVALLKKLNIFKAVVVAVAIMAVLEQIVYIPVEVVVQVILVIHY